jgi:cytochrome c oxidase assembly protein subunit 15
MNGGASAERGPGDLLAVGFGTTVAMWAIAYTSRLLELHIKAPTIIFALLCLATVLLLGCHVAGGLVIGRFTPRGISGGAEAGLLTGVLNLLAVASAFGGDQPNHLRPSAPLWIGGTLLAAVALTSLGAALASRGRRPRSEEPDWHGGLAAVAACATFMLLMIGGFVTGLDEGLAVVDWPNTETYNMFLYPLSHMTGGIFLEHAHRLFGSLVGLTTLVLMIQVLNTERRRAVKALAIAALIGVAIQGTLGGLRVTGRFTFSANPADTQPSVVLAVVHGVFGQMVFGTLVALALLRSRAWRRSASIHAAPSAGVDRLMCTTLLVLLLTQLAMGALVRHFTWALYKLRHELATDPAHMVSAGHWALTIHVTLAVLVTLAAVGVGVRAWGLYPALRPLSRLGSWLLALIGLQLTLGILALVVTGNDAPGNPPGLPDAVITTAHQAVGAALLALVVLLLLWNWRLLSPAAAEATFGDELVAAGRQRGL